MCESARCFDSPDRKVPSLLPWRVFENSIRDQLPLFTCNRRPTCRRLSCRRRSFSQRSSFFFKDEIPFITERHDVRLSIRDGPWNVKRLCLVLRQDASFLPSFPWRRNYTSINTVPTDTWLWTGRGRRMEIANFNLFFSQRDDLFHVNHVCTSR